MSRLQRVLSFLALPADQQIELLPGIPRDRGASDYYTASSHNPLLLLLRGVSEEYSQPESESDRDYLTRTRMQPGRNCAAMNELSCFIYLLCHHYCADDYWTQRALLGKDEWRLIRRLAGLTLAEAGLEISCVRQDIQNAVDVFQKQFAHL